MPPVSIIITTHEQCEELRQNLPVFLEQEYPSDYEVIVVDMNSTDDTPALLESMQYTHQNLRLIRTPDSARDISPLRLALTLAIRSAANEWLVITQADCRPASKKWLSIMADACEQKPGTQIVLGCTRYVGGEGWSGLRQRFFRTWQQRMHMYYAKRHGAYRCDGTNLCYRRSLFLSHRGFAEHANLLMGATDIMVNHHSTEANTAVCTAPDATMLQQTPRRDQRWDQDRLFFMETRRHFQRKWGYRMMYLGLVALTLLCTVLLFATIATALVKQQYIVAGLTIAVALAYFSYRTYAFNQFLKSVGEPPITLFFPLLIHLIPVWDTEAWFRWLFTDKHVFQKKFI